MQEDGTTMKQLTIELTNENYRLLEYYLNGRFGKRGKMQNKARAVLLQFIADEARKDLDEAEAELNKDKAIHP